MTARVTLTADQLYDHQKLVVVRKDGGVEYPVGELTEQGNTLVVTAYAPTELVIREEAK